MSRMHEVAGAVLLGVMAACAVRAEAQLSPGTASVSAAKTNGGARHNDSAQDPRRDKEGEKSLTLRCWQYGRLILEEPVTTAPSASGNIVFARPGDPRPVELINFGEAVCLVK
jgi:hypothetical protein